MQTFISAIPVLGIVKSCRIVAKTMTIENRGKVRQYNVRLIGAYLLWSSSDPTIYSLICYDENAEKRRVKIYPTKDIGNKLSPQ